MASSSESDVEVGWRRKKEERQEDDPRGEFWATPPKKRKVEPDGQPVSKSAAKACIIRSCSRPVKANARHIKYFHMPSFMDEPIDENTASKCIAFLTLICTLLGLQTLSQLVDKVKQKKLFASFLIEISQKDRDLVNCLANELKGPEVQGFVFHGVTHVSHLVHWSVLGRLVDYLSPDQQFALFSQFPTAAAKKEINANNFVIAGDSIVRNLPSYLNFNVPVICAPGVRMCTPDKDKWLVRFWVPVLEAIIRHQKPHFIFHLGTNNISSLKSKAPKVVIQEAKELCQRLWNLNKTILITFSAILYRKASEAGIVLEVNDRIRQLTATDDRLQFVDFSGVLSEDRWFRSDGVHLSDDGIKEFARCFNDLFLRKFQ